MKKLLLSIFRLCSAFWAPLRRSAPSALKFGVLALLFSPGFEIRAALNEEAQSLAAKISRSPVFYQQLLPVGAIAPSETENQTLWSAIEKIGRNGIGPDVSALENFIVANPNSPWTPSVRANLGRYYREHGRYTLALAHWEATWNATKNATDDPAKKIADFTFAHWTKLLASLGRLDTLRSLLKETDSRVFDGGPLQQMVNSTKEGYHTMLTEPGICFKCGTFALNNVARVIKGPGFDWQTLDQIPSPKSGFSMATLTELAERASLDLVPAEWGQDKSLVVPSIVHWKENHYAAIIEEKNGRYRVVDPTFGKPQWLTGDDIREETTGYFMVSNSKLPLGWKQLDATQTREIYGRGFSTGVDDTSDSCQNGSGGAGSASGGGVDDGSGLMMTEAAGGGVCDRGCGGGSGGPGPKPPPPPPPPCDCDDSADSDPLANPGSSDPAVTMEMEGRGMPFWSVSEPYLNVWIYDRPLGYQPGLGNSIVFKLAYKQRESRAVTANAFSLGSHWNCSWLSYVEFAADESDAPSPRLFMRAGGQRDYEADGATHEFFGKSLMNRSTDGSAHTTGYSVAHRNNAVENYNVVVSVDGVKRAYLTERIDPRGHATRFSYNTNNPIKLTAVTDADGRLTILSYTNVSYPAQITGVTDPFGRHTTLKYNSAGMLTNVVDVADLTNSFAYDYQGWITNLATPYGSTSFQYGTNSDTAGNEFGTDDGTHNPYVAIRTVKVTDPAGGVNLYMLRQNCYKIYTNSADYYVNTNNFIPFLPTSYDSLGIVPSGTPTPLGSFGSQLDHSDNLGYRNSFHWGPRQAAALPANLNFFLPSDYIKARMRHWLHGPYDGPERPYISQSLSIQQDPSPDGVNMGQTIWFDHEGKIHQNYESSILYPLAGVAPAVIARVLPDGTTSFISYRFDEWGHATNILRTYSLFYGQTPLLRSNILIYAANGLDLLKVIGPRGELQNGYAYNASHDVIYSTNAVGEVSTNIFDTIGRLTTTKTPAGLTTANIYFASGDYTNFIQTRIDVEISRTNSYTYSNDLLATRTDERGVTTTYTYDNLQRPLTVADSRGTISYTYANLDLIKVVDRLGFTTSFAYDNLRRTTFETNALGRVTRYNYCTCGALDSMQDAAGSYTYYNYNSAGWLTNTLYADGLNTYREYDLLSRTIRTFDGGGHYVTNWYNNQGRPYAVSNLFGQLSLSIFDDEDRATNHLDANSVIIKSAFDNAGRITSRSYPDAGVEHFAYSARGLIAYTNQLNSPTHYGYDEAYRKIAETNANNEVRQFHYDPSSNLTNLLDAKNQNTFWNYDEFSRVTNKVDHLVNIIFKYAYDGDNRLTNRWTPAKGTTSYSYDNVGNLLTINHQLSPSINFGYDSLNRLTNMVDGIGANTYGYDDVGQLLSDDGPWLDDTLNYAYANRLRSSLSLLQPNAGPWTQSYSFDDARRLTTIISPAGEFDYRYKLNLQGVVTGILFPGGSLITNIYDSSARLLGTWLEKNGSTVLNAHTYSYNQGNQRTQQVFTVGNYVDYTYDPIGQLRTAFGKESGGASRLQEKLGYTYDAAGNLNFRTNNALIQDFEVNSLNELASYSRNSTNALTVAGTTTSAATDVSVNSASATLYGDATFAKDGFTPADGDNTFTAIAHDSYGRESTDSIHAYLPLTNAFVYDLNGNLLSDSHRAFDYDDENELIRMTVTNAWKSEFSYDGKLRRRIRKEFTWSSGAWFQTNEVHYVYDGNLVLQERWFDPQLSTPNPQQSVTYTRGRDLSGTREAAGGIGGLLARSAPSTLNPSSPQHAFYHSDGNGNITCLINSNQAILAKYVYDPYGNTLSISGPLAEANLYRFSSKEAHPNSGFYYFAYRFYDPALQRWLNTDPLGERGSINRYAFSGNQPVSMIDFWGLRPSSSFGPYSGPYGGGQGHMRPSMPRTEPGGEGKDDHDSPGGPNDEEIRPSADPLETFFDISSRGAAKLAVCLWGAARDLLAQQPRQHIAVLGNSPGNPLPTITITLTGPPLSPPTLPSWTGCSICPRNGPLVGH